MEPKRKETDFLLSYEDKYFFLIFSEYKFSFFIIFELLFLKTKISFRFFSPESIILDSYSVLNIFHF